jgi:thiamine-monophosphate kinase
MSTLRQIGEVDLIRRLAGRLKSRSDVVVGVGDDAAVVRGQGPYDLVLTSDPVIEGVHFLPGAQGRKIGHKAMGRVLSDLAAMGAEPLWALVDLVAPPRTNVRRIQDIYSGATRLADRHGLVLVGGDTTRGPVLELHVFSVGRVPRGTALLRSGARKGDGLYVTGTLGGSGEGRHLVFEPRVKEGQWLRAQGWARSLMDVSDGLALDARRLAKASGVGVELYADRIPISQAARKNSTPKKSWERALCEGEDFELLFTVPARKQKTFERAWKKKFPLRCTCIGRITGTAGALMVRDRQGNAAPLRKTGFEHFR